MSLAVNGWHLGQPLLHKRLGHNDDYSIMMLYQSVGGGLPGDHAFFHTTRVSFLPVTTLDASGRPWGSILSGKEGTPGFIRNPRYSVLSMDFKVWPGEPIIENMKGYRNDDSMLMAGIGVEFSTRKRYKLSGKVTGFEAKGDKYHIDLFVDEAISNCPKYINGRELEPHPYTNPIVIHEKRKLDASERLPEDVISFITQCDTVFFGTAYIARGDDALRYPSHLGMNHRGGREGFVRVKPSDGRTVVLPDFSGNRFLTSLGNIEATPLACLTLVSFETGDILYLTGEAMNLFNSDAQQLMPFQNALTTIRVTGYVYVSDALPVRQRPNTNTQYSPYSPFVRLLTEEAVHSIILNKSPPVNAVLAQVRFHSPTIATFSWETSAPIPLTSGQAIILDFSFLLGARRYQHMAPMKPMSVNDDRLRTWSVSSSSPPGRTTSKFSITMREQPGGLITSSTLFNVARRLKQIKPDLLGDTRPFGLTVGVMGVTGKFKMTGLGPADVSDEKFSPPSPVEGAEEPVTRFLWIAGGMGITPFLAMLGSLQATSYDIRLVLSAREPEVFIPMVESRLRSCCAKKIKLTIDVYSEKPIPDFGAKEVVMRRFKGRVTRKTFEDGDDTFKREPFIYGPKVFERAMVAILVGMGVEKKNIKKEGWVYL